MDRYSKVLHNGDNSTSTVLHVMQNNFTPLKAQEKN